MDDEKVLPVSPSDELNAVKETEGEYQEGDVGDKTDDVDKDEDDNVDFKDSREGGSEKGDARDEPTTIRQAKVGQIPIGVFLSAARVQTES